MAKQFLILAAMAAAAATPAWATTVVDPVGDFLPSYAGPQLPDLDVTSFSVDFDAGSNLFTVGWTLAGAVTPGTPGFYVLGVNTGAGATAPFADVGAPDVVFDQVVVLQKDGTGLVAGGPVLDSSAIRISGNMVSLSLPLSLFPSTGATPGLYGWNLWPRGTGVGNAQITDFAPNNAMLAAVPEPGTWLTMLLGFAGVGMAMRRRRLRPVAA